MAYPLLPFRTGTGLATKNDRKEASLISTKNILQVVKHLIQLKNETGKTIHIDIEPEPGGLIENGGEFIKWYDEELLPSGIAYMQSHLNMNEGDAVVTIKEHVQLCYDVCHFAVGYENVAAMVDKLKVRGIKTGKIQISAALKSKLSSLVEERVFVTEAFQQFNEPIYLHQVIALLENGELKQYNDLPEALADANNMNAKEWRAHFHVPIFIKDYGVLQSTQQDIEDVLSLQKHQPFTSHLEIETYTWEVLPEDLKLPLQQSIVREIEWVVNLLKRKSS